MSKVTYNISVTPFTVISGMDEAIKRQKEIQHELDRISVSKGGKVSEQLCAQAYKEAYGQTANNSDFVLQWLRKIITE